MLTDQKGPTRTYPYRITNGKSNDGMWVVDVASDQYRAWRYWLHHDLGKNFFPEPTMQVWFEWPPGTQVFADHVAQALSDARDGFYTPMNGKTETRPVGGLPVPRHPRPWDGYIPEPEPEPVLIDRDAMRAIRERLTPRSKRNNEAWVQPA